MRKILSAVVLLALLGTGCATTPSGGGTTPVTPGTTFKNCSSEALTQAATGILGAVTQALATGNYVGAVAGLVTMYGEAEVACAMELAVSEIQQRLDNTPTNATLDPVLVAQHKNGQAWLADYAAKHAAKSAP